MRAAVILLSQNNLIFFTISAHPVIIQQELVRSCAPFAQLGPSAQIHQPVLHLVVVERSVGVSFQKHTIYYFNSRMIALTFQPFLFTSQGIMY